MAIDLTSTTDTEHAPEMVKWDGAEYELGDAGSLTIGEQVRMMRAAERLQVLTKPEELASLSDEAITALDADMRWLVAAALPSAPSESIDKLCRKPEKAMQLIEAFSVGVASQETTTTPSSTLSAASNDSTGEALSSGLA